MKITSLLPLAFSIAAVAGVVTAGEDSTLTVEGEVFVTKTAAPAHLENVDEIFSGWTFRTDETQALQMDDFDNPSFVFCLLYTSPSPRDQRGSRMPSSA